MVRHTKRRINAGIAEVQEVTSKDFHTEARDLSLCLRAERKLNVNSEQRSFGAVQVVVEDIRVEAAFRFQC